MIGDAMIITVSVCLFIYLGLFDAISGILKRLVPVNSEKIGHLSEKLKCSKCISFWLTLAYSIACGGSVIRCILVSFLCALAALWIDLLLAYINKKYDRLWEDL